MEDKKVSPLKHPFLRQAGQYLDEKISEILESWETDVTTCLAVIFSCVLVWVEYFSSSIIFPVVLSLFGVATLIYVAKKFRATKKVIGNYSLGSDGEKYVAGFLSSHIYEGYIFNDFLVSSETKPFNIDHILLSSKGVFTIETKTQRKKSLGADPIQKTDLLEKQIYQASGESVSLGKILNFQNIQPVLLFPGRFVKLDTNSNNVWIMNEVYFMKKLAGLPDVLSRLEIDTLREKLYSLQINQRG